MLKGKKIATPPTDCTVSIMALHMLLCGMNSGMTVLLYTSWRFIFWLIYSSDHYSQSTALAWLSHWAVVTKLESAKFPHPVSLPSLWHWCHNFREGWNNKHSISSFLSSPSGWSFMSSLSRQLHICKALGTFRSLSWEPDLPHRCCYLLLAITMRTSQG